MEILTIKGKQDFNIEITAPSSKSFSHRYILGAFFCGKRVKVSNIIYSKDTLATLGAIEAMGAEVEKGNNYVYIFFDRQNYKKENVEIDCNESASTLRFIIPIVASLGIKCKIFGKKSLMERPLNVYTELFDKIGLNYEYKKGEYIKINGTLSGGIYEIDGNISSQFITGLLFALSVCNEKSTLKINKTLESKPYVDITLEVLKYYGVNIINNNYKCFEIEPNQTYIAKDVTVEGDYSQGCAFIGASLLGGKVKINNLLKNSVQGDIKFVDFMIELGGNIKVYDTYIECEKSKLVSGKTFDISNCPDIAPVLSAVCAFSKGKTEIVGIKRLRIKESDRVKSIIETLKGFGADASYTEEKITINGTNKVNGGTFDTFNDHRIAMMISVMSVCAEDEISLKTPMCVEKSYPSFYKDFKGIITIKQEK